LGLTRSIAPTNGTVGAAHSPAAAGVAICRDGSITSRPYKCVQYT